MSFRAATQNDISVGSIHKTRDVSHQLSALVYGTLEDIIWNIKLSINTSQVFMIIYPRLGAIIFDNHVHDGEDDQEAERDCYC
jgi:hypothetical protein